MSRHLIEKWISKMKQFWLQKDIDSVVALFHNNCIYYEHPLQKPGHGRQDIRKFWDEIKEQTITKLNIDILAIEGNTAIAHWYLQLISEPSQVEALHEEYDGVYLLRFDDQMFCVEFKQWWVNKSE